MEEGRLTAGESTAAARCLRRLPARGRAVADAAALQDLGAPGLHARGAGTRKRIAGVLRGSEYRGPRGQRKGFGWRDLRNLVVRARIQLGGPTVLVWDNLRLHLTAAMREFMLRTPPGSPSSNNPPAHPP
jgi:hypothetical protein